MTPGDPPLAIEVRGLSKTYRLGELANLVRFVITSLRQGERPQRAELEAIRAVGFKVRIGECVGILGRNGSGKSTLLQILSGITVPSSGVARVWGRVLPLLEVGEGFHPELTGRENVVLFGTILGLTSKEIDSAMPDIVAFAELERHLDTPVKRYSAGMQARLSFAIAMRFPADIYIFDEVLAVVDDSFRSRCLTEIQALIDAGRTILFVSHDLDTVRALCSRGVWLDAGSVRAEGPIDEVADLYEQSGTAT